IPETFGVVLSGHAESQTARLLHQPRAFTARVQRSCSATGEGYEPSIARAPEILVHFVDEPRRILRDPRVWPEASPCRKRGAGGTGQRELRGGIAHGHGTNREARDRAIPLAERRADPGHARHGPPVRPPRRLDGRPPR